MAVAGRSVTVTIRGRNTGTGRSGAASAVFFKDSPDSSFETSAGATFSASTGISGWYLRME